LVSKSENNQEVKKALRTMKIPMYLAISKSTVAFARAVSGRW
jgi:hypothetical protein